MQEAMSSFIHQTFEDADVLLYLVTPEEAIEDHKDTLVKVAGVEAPKFLVLNKCDLIDTHGVDALLERYRRTGVFQKYMAISAKEGAGIDALMTTIRDALPEGPEYFPKDQLTDRPERFFITEIIRENILELYYQEIPYSCEVGIDEFKEGEGRDGDVTKIRATIYVNRPSQKPILIGKGGEAIKQLGIASRKSIEKFINSRVHLELFVKVRENWRNDERALKEFGYRT
jgi:GTP-binding protein Era